MQSANPTEVIVSLDIEADLERVWQALTTGEGLARWMGNGSLLGRSAGDELYFTDVVTGAPKRGIVDELIPQRSVAYTWWPETDPDDASEVSIRLEPCESGTRVTVVESRPESAAGPTMASTASRRGSSWAWRTALLVLAAQSMLAVTAVRA